MAQRKARGVTTTARQYIERAQTILAEYEAECSADEYTDTDQLWADVFPFVMADLRSALTKRLDDDEPDWTPADAHEAMLHMERHGVKCEEC